MTSNANETPWSLKGVSPEVRKLAKRAASEAGLPIGTCLCAAIRGIGEAEHRVREAGTGQPEPPASAGELRQALGGIAPGLQQAGLHRPGQGAQGEPNPVKQMQQALAAAEIRLPAQKRSTDTG